MDEHGLSLEVARAIRTHRDEVVRIWEERVTKRLAEAGTETTLPIVDTLPHFLDLLAGVFVGQEGG